MHATSRRIAPEATAALELVDLVVSGPLRAVTANADGSWTVTPVIGQPLTLTGPAEVSAYVDRATHGTGPAALAPVPAPAPALPAAADADDDEPEGCGCASTTCAAPLTHGADTMAARAICAGLDDFGVSARRRSVGYDDAAQAVAVRIATDHGIYALHIPPVHRPYTVTRNGQRDGAIGARRVPAVSISLVTTLFATYLRERGVL